MSLVGNLIKKERRRLEQKGILQPKKWDQGNDIYGVRGNSLYENEAAGDADHLDKNMGVTRSSFYHSYWRGWSERRVDRPGKPFKIERVYTAPWIRQDVSNRDYVLYRLLYGVLFLLAVVLFTFAMTRRVGSNYCWYVAMFGMPATILIFIVLFMFVGYAKAPRKMTLWEHHASSDYLRRSALVFSILLAATALSTVVYTVLNRADEPLRQLMNVGLDLVSAAAIFAIYRIEKKMKYADVPNDNKAPAGSHEIR